VVSALRRAVFIAGFACVCWGWGNRPLCAAIAAWGLATSASRALMGRHYISDVVAGIALGIVTTAIVTQVGFGKAPDAVLVGARTASATNQATHMDQRTPPWQLANVLGPWTVAPSLFPCSASEELGLAPHESSPH